MLGAFLGLAASMVAVALTVYQGIRYRRWLPKRDVTESLEALKLRLEETEEEYDELREKVFTARQDINSAEELKDWMERTRDEVADLQSLKAQFDEVDASLATKTHELGEAESRLNTVSAELERQQAQLLSQEDYEAAKKEHEHLVEDSNGLRGEVSRLRTESQELHESLDELQDEAGHLAEERDALRREKIELEETTTRLTARKDSLERYIDDLKESKLQLGGPAGGHGVEESTALLWEPTVNRADFEHAGPSNESEQNALEEAIGRIREAGFIYHDRVLRAFHTSLKCAEEAPLLVLAGISGTGKSALPTRYSEAMGIHLLNVAVQPGWDSPADLLGFYNHLEGRFRPTDLTRALLQMDYVRRSGPQANSSGEWPESSSAREDASDRMLLVLLDEMNLARVEYYFSEFLSCLELRRGVNPDDRLARQRAEIHLDLGFAGEGQAQSLSVYPGENVLFVGTMNEDESTQSLSDKVIDRSNVMRFGRPNRLVTSETHAGAASRRASFLPRSTWSRWLREGQALSDQESDLVNRWTSTLNEHLSEIGRPFAHRVAAAMKTYVRHYPYRGGRSLHDAFADQVEFRVLPRLRGLDVHDQAAASAVQGIHRLLESDLEDGVLAQALDAAWRHSGDQLFHWSGVDRVDDSATTPV